MEPWEGALGMLLWPVPGHKARRMFGTTWDRENGAGIVPRASRDIHGPSVF